MPKIYQGINTEALTPAYLKRCMARAHSTGESKIFDHKRYFWVGTSYWWSRKPNAPEIKRVAAEIRALGYLVRVVPYTETFKGATERFTFFYAREK